MTTTPVCFLPSAPINVRANIIPSRNFSNSKLSRSRLGVRRSSCNYSLTIHASTQTSENQTNLINQSDLPLVPILMGSASDTPHCEKIARALESFGIVSEMRIASAHKVPSRLLELLATYEEDPRPKVYIAVAGRSNALSGVLDCAVSYPVVSCPPYSDTFGGADLFSSIRMPSGVAPALILDPSGAALFAAKILSLYSPQIRGKVRSLQAANRHKLIADDAALVASSYLPRISMTREANISLNSTDSTLIFGSDDNSIKRIQGKVRDRYEFTGTSNSPMVALVTTDRQSAFDRVLAAVPYKGSVLNLVSSWWFSKTKHIIPNHVIDIPHSNITVAHRCKPFAIEFVVRGYITGSTKTSLWKNYSELGKREYCGIHFPDGLVKNQRLASPVLTPTTKSDFGDRPIAPVDIISEGIMTQKDFDICANAAMELFKYGQQVAIKNGLILVDTKYEFGRSETDGVIRLIDEIHTPDSSRYWLAASYESRFSEGKEPENIDKEFLRLWFAENSDPYNTSVPLPEAPKELVDKLSMKYIMLYELITGERFDFDEAERKPSEIAGCMRKFTSADAATPSRVKL